VEQKMPQRGEKGQYGYVRQPEEKAKKGRKKKAKAIDQHATSEECSKEFVNMLGISAAGPSHLQPAMDPSGMGVPPVHPPITSLHQLVAMDNPCTVPPPPVPVGNPNVRATSTEEELEDDGSEWAVRIGDAPPPMWAKRSAPDERDEDEDNDNKRPRLEKFVHLSASSF
jgi:hypothetical protein